MTASALQSIGTGGGRGWRLALVGVAVAFACGFASLHTGERDGVAGLVAPPVLGAADPLGAAWRPPVRDRTPRARAPSEPVATAADSRSAPPSAAPLSTEPSATEPPPATGPLAVRPGSFDVGAGAFAWRAVHGEVDGRLWRFEAEPPGVAGDAGRPPVDGPGDGRGLDGIGFPGIARAPGEGMRVYRPLVAWNDTADGRVPIADVRCMGLRPASVARRAARYEARIVELAIEHAISASLVKAVIAVESCYDPAAVSHVGAIGLMQLMPATAAWLEVTDPRDPDANLRAGIGYLAALRRRFGDTTLALAAYNAGPGNVTRYGGVPPFAETHRYITRVTANHRRYVAATALAAR